MSVTGTRIWMMPARAYSVLRRAAVAVSKRQWHRGGGGGGWNVRGAGPFGAHVDDGDHPLGLQRGHVVAERQRAQQHALVDAGAERIDGIAEHLPKALRKPRGEAC